MKPTPNQMVDGIRAVLRETVLPASASDETQIAVRQIMVVLRETDWDEFAFALLRENAALAALAGEAAAWIGAQHERQAAFTGLQTGLKAGAEGLSEDGSFAHARQRNLELRKALADFVDGCAAHHASPVLDGFAQLRARMACGLADIAAAGPVRRRRPAPREGGPKA